MKNTLVTLWHTFARYRLQLVILIVFGFLGALLEGIGINAVIPLVSFFSGATSGPTNFISHAIQTLFSFLHIPFSFRYLLGFILGLFILRGGCRGFRLVFFCLLGCRLCWRGVHWGAVASRAGVPVTLDDVTARAQFFICHVRMVI